MLRWWPFLLLCCAFRSAGQDALRKPVSLPASTLSAERLRREVSRQTGLQFSFGSHTLRPGQLLRFPKRNYAAKDLLDALKRQLHAEYRVYQDHIIFKPVHKQSAHTHPSANDRAHLSDGAERLSGKLANSPDKRARLSQKQAGPGNRTAQPTGGRALSNSPPAHSQGRAIYPGNTFLSKDGTSNTQDGSPGPNDGAALSEPGSSRSKAEAFHSKVGSTGPEVAPSGSEDSRFHTVDAKAGTMHSLPGWIDGKEQGPIPTVRADERLQLRINRLAPEARGAVEMNGARAYRQKQARWRAGNGIIRRYAAVGLEVTEYFPANAAFKAGIPLLHGIIGYGSNFARGSLRYGGGTRWSFNERWHAQAYFTTGKITKPYVADSAGFVRKTLKITERLQRIGLQAERTIGQRWSLVAGVSWNMLNRTNTENGMRLAPGDRIFNGPFPREGYRAMKPLFTSSSSFDEGSKTWKDRWPGVQAGVYFRF